jgi:hypothetical protein
MNSAVQGLDQWGQATEVASYKFPVTTAKPNFPGR